MRKRRERGRERERERERAYRATRGRLTEAAVIRPIKKHHDITAVISDRSFILKIILEPVGAGVVWSGLERFGEGSPGFSMISSWLFTVKIT